MSFSHDSFTLGDTIVFDSSSFHVTIVLVGDGRDDRRILVALIGVMHTYLGGFLLLLSAA